MARSLRKRLQPFAPLAMSVALVAWVASRVSPARIAQALSTLNWYALLPLTGVMILATYLWDSFSVMILYSVEQAPVRYRQALGVRGASYLVGALNHQLGHALLAWRMAKLQDLPLIAVLTRGLMLPVHDLFALTMLGLCGSLMADFPQRHILQRVCGTTLIAMTIVAIAIRTWQRTNTRNRILEWARGWKNERSLKLVVSRLLFFLIIVAYARAALAICGIEAAHATVFAKIPLVLLADAVPSLSGLGTRETALRALFAPTHAQEATLVAMSLVWSMGVLFGRFAIGVAHVVASRLSARGETD